MAVREGKRLFFKGSFEKEVKVQNQLGWRVMSTNPGEAKLEKGKRNRKWATTTEAFFFEFRQG